MKIAIVGLGETGADAPWDDPAWKIWGLNGGHRGRFRRPDRSLRADVWFQIHPPEACDDSELDWMRRLGDDVHVPTYVRPEDLQYWADLNPKAAALALLWPYPIEQVREAFPGGWFANTFCLEMAWAILQGATDIGLYGVECGNYGRELAVERPAVAYWMGVAHGHGVMVRLPQTTTLHYTPIYGFDYWPEARRAAELTEMLLPPREDLDRVNLDTIAAVDAAEDKVNSGA